MVVNHWRVAVGAADQAAHGAHDVMRAGHVYQFGVFAGNSMRQLFGYLRPGLMWGMDSFRGLPETLDSAERVAKWGPGKYASDPRHRLEAELGAAQLRWVPGFYNDSLRDEKVKALGMKAARYVDIDCDLYESAYTALDFMFRNALITSGTLVGYDDWWVLPCGAGNQQVSPLQVGEGRAHAAMAAKYRVHFQCVAGSCNGCRNLSPEACDKVAWGAVFLVKSIGGGSPEGGRTGFELSAEDVLRFKQTSNDCKRAMRMGNAYALKRGRSST